ncbi:MAG: DNA-directed RNA polymerase subunit omega [Victivallaceae bacterium]|nr:DNA-directed RNA polymerase subunit omega [Victivallaceae bacterium]
MNNEYLERAKQRITDPEILAVVVSRRAKQLAKKESRPMVKCPDPDATPLDIALLEIAEGLLSYEFEDEEAKDEKGAGK